LLLAFASVQAQNSPTEVDRKKHKVVFHLTSSDTLVHKAILKQLNNVLQAAPNTRLEVVCHANGIDFLTSAKTRNGAKIREMKARGVDFVACENTLRDRNMKREEIVKEARMVPVGVLELVRRQEQGWSYIKAGL
jgi:intracellular sulfur oxidation DsrE/DsrF family protein